jgi:hypothetical protein
MALSEERVQLSAGGLMPIGKELLPSVTHKHTNHFQKLCIKAMIYYYIIANGNGHHLFGHPAAERNQQESDPRQGNSSINR